MGWFNVEFGLITYGLKLLYNRYWFGSVLHRFSITGTENRTKPDRFSLVRFGFLSEPKNSVFFFGLDWFGSSVPLDFSDPLTPLIFDILLNINKINKNKVLAK
jgi:hypothetical protein